ncbi:step II splicing factor [Plasmodium gonderi]|uniref:Pre-mRNA-splicing factor SLU7 n=1 Tax=Plasmodium gonderi TaxID=77519 RepID=A0A1Y1JI60_PLAGO|nr:step II splicing factor [Plasmodium gonderi]GAW81920.1 step II splicing factor [Plasmodium gonderi]
MNTKNVTREDKKKEKELNEARKAGKIEALKDEEGNDINPHMPQYIIKAPWYLNQTKPGLKHQRYKGTDKVKIEEERNKKIYIKKNVKNNTDFCKNCGSLAHKEKNCLERTRKKKINFVNKDNDNDFLCVTQDLGYDGNRDRWVGYNPNNFEYIYKEYEKIAEEKKKRKAEELKKKYEKKSIKKKKRNVDKERQGGGGIDDAEDADKRDGNRKNNNTEGTNHNMDNKNEEDNSESDIEEDEEGEEEEEEEEDGMQDDEGKETADELKEDGVKNNGSSNNNMNKNEKNRNVARNLRIREDTAKYLYNLSLNSAFYDPKSRSMREDPFANIRKNLGEDENYYKGENYYNNTDEAIESKKLEIFAWETYKRGENVHFNAQPTQLELLYKEFLEKKKKLIKKKEEDILKTYKCENMSTGLKNHENEEEELIHSEIYTEYKPIDQIDTKTKKIKVLSKYEEDIHIFDHSSIFGSYYDKEKKKWGYKCCLSTNKFEKCFHT